MIQHHASTAETNHDEAAKLAVHSNRTGDMSREHHTAILTIDHSITLHKEDRESLCVFPRRGQILAPTVATGQSGGHRSPRPPAYAAHGSKPEGDDSFESDSPRAHAL